jgi:pSer/pThr/pTyr-binding forkhead associated (FHA) protein
MMLDPIGRMFEVSNAVAYLQTYFEGQFSSEIELSRRVLTVGRGSRCDIRIDNAAISSFHAILSPDGDSFVIEDAASTNGLIVNGKRTHRHRLEFGDEVELPKHTLRYVENTGGLEAPTATATRTDQGQSATFEVDVTELVDLVAARQKQTHPVVTVQSPRDGASEHTLSKVHLRIGKGRDCDVRIGGWRVPRLAATISRQANGFHLVPESNIEITVNGTAVTKPWRLDHGDTIELVDMTLSFSNPVAA